MIRRLPTAIGLLAATTLAACSGGSDTPPPPANETDNVVVIDETPPENVVAVEPSLTPTPEPTPIVAEDLPEEQQVQEDADAVGMTARLPRQDGEEAAQPAE